MAKPKRLKSGNWRTQVYLGKRDGKNVYVSITAPTKTECAYKAAIIKKNGMPDKKGASPTVGQVIDQYIASCELLSPTTVAGYEKIRRTMFADLMDMPAAELSSEALQKAINAETRRKSRRGHNISPKSVRNAYGLVAASMRAICGKAFTVKLPEDLPKFLELPEPDFVINAVQGSEIELPCMLALWLSLSMSEVRGLKYSSIRNGCLYIDQVVVDVNGVPVEKQRAKVASRNRCLALPEPLMQLIRNTTEYDKYEAGKIFDGYLWPYSHDKIRHELKKRCPGITFHQLRHMNASIMLKLNIPEKYAMERGGWSTPNTMKKVYQHTFNSERRRVDAIIDTYFEQKYCTKYTQEPKKPEKSTF